MKDKDSTIVDNTSQKRLELLKDIINKYLPEENKKSYTLPWTDNGIDWQNSEEHQTYLNSFIEDFIEGVKKLVLYAKEQWKIKNRDGHLYGELLEHARCCHYHARSFRYCTRYVTILLGASYQDFCCIDKLEHCTHLVYFFQKRLRNLETLIKTLTNA